MSLSSADSGARSGARFRAAATSRWHRAGTARRRQTFVAFALSDCHLKSIGRYARGERDREPVTRGRLVDLYVVIAILREGTSELAIKSWMLGTNLCLACHR